VPDVDDAPRAGLSNRFAQRFGDLTIELDLVPGNVNDDQSEHQFPEVLLKFKPPVNGDQDIEAVLHCLD